MACYNRIASSRTDYPVHFSCFCPQERSRSVPDEMKLVTKRTLDSTSVGVPAATSVLMVEDLSVRIDHLLSLSLASVLARICRI